VICLQYGIKEPATGRLYSIGMIKQNSQMNQGNSTRHIYDDAFYQYIQEGSIRSARRVVPQVTHLLNIQSILDVGCGRGAWLTEYQQQGVKDLCGVDGDYVQKETLLIPAENFHPKDIGQPFDLQRRFDLVQCLEVAEHLPSSRSETLIDNLVRHSGRILFSAAVPGQGGENHINEQSYEFWRAIFDKHGYKPFDCVRPLIRNFTDIEFWYRHNVVLYVAQELIPTLDPAIAKTRIAEDEPVPDIAGLLFKLRSRILAVLSPSLVSKLALLKHRCVLAYRARLQRRST
jgi:SAM-dependent methyltransferase